MPPHKERQQLSLRGTLHKIIYTNNENGYLIGALKTSEGTVSIVGYMMEPREGDDYAITGAWTTHPKYGRQFQFESYEVKEPTTLHGVEEYLASGLIHGVGPALASRIVKKFGIKTLDILNNNPERLMEVEGVGKKKLDKIVESASSLREMQDVMTYLKLYNVSTSQAIRIFKVYGKGAAGVVKNNPVPAHPGCAGHRLSDRRLHRPARRRSAREHVPAGSRHPVRPQRCLPRGRALLSPERRTRPPVGGTSCRRRNEDRPRHRRERPQRISRRGGRHPFPVSPSPGGIGGGGQGRPASPQRLKAVFRTEAPRVALAYRERHGIEFDAKQRNAILHSIKKPITILTGGPGTGKTLCVNGIIELADELGVNYLLCAPTGRAAKRLSELSSREAKTIHRLLEYEPQSGMFRRGADTPLDCDMLIVDEVSMVDIELFAALLDAVKPEAQLVLVGDVDQLPSVGPGQVLRDLIEAKIIGTVRLDTIFRQSEESTIIANSHRIDAGEMPVFSPDFKLLEETSAENMQETIVRLCSTILPQNYQYDQFDDVQVLSPMHNGAAGVRELNRELQRALNGNSKLCWQGSERKFLMGDKVMQTKNNYDKDVFNGDLGRIAGVDKDDGILFVEFYGKKVEYTFEQLDELTLAYAMTIHKSQGNEFKAVIVPVSTSHYIMLQRNLIYTAVTRARELLILVGEMKALAIAVRNDEVRERNTLLRKRLQQI